VTGSGLGRSPVELAPSGKPASQWGSGRLGVPSLIFCIFSLSIGTAGPRVVAPERDAIDDEWWGRYNATEDAETRSVGGTDGPVVTRADTRTKWTNQSIGHRCCAS